MNKDRRIRIAVLAERLQNIRSELETLAEEEREAYDNMPEGLQSSERGEKAEQSATALETAVEQIDDALTSLEESAE